MTANPETLEKIAGIIRDELPNYLSADFIINDVKAENRTGPDEEDFVYIRVILEDDHPELDPHKMLEFSSDMRDVCQKAGIIHPPNISYSDRGELSR